MKASSIRRSRELVAGLEREVMELKQRHSNMFDTFLELNNRYQKTDTDQIRAYTEGRHSDVRRYDVLIRNICNENIRICKELDKVGAMIKTVSVKLITAKKVSTDISLKTKSTASNSKPVSYLMINFIIFLFYYFIYFIYLFI